MGLTIFINSEASIGVVIPLFETVNRHHGSNFFMRSPINASLDIASVVSADTAKKEPGQRFGLYQLGSSPFILLRMQYHPLSVEQY